MATCSASLGLSQLLSAFFQALGAVSKNLSVAVGFVFRLLRCQAQKVLDVGLLRLRAFSTFRLASEKHARPHDKTFLETAPIVFHVL